MRILQINAFEEGGGAEAMASALHSAYRRLGHEATLMVGRRRGQRKIDGLVVIPQTFGRGALSSALLALAERRKGLPGAGLLHLLARPKGLIERLRGREDFDFPGTAKLLSLLQSRPQIVHIHNMHGGYMDPGRLLEMSMGAPTVVTLHDCWAFTGHCAHPFSCDRWKTGCGDCPDLTIPPPLWRDATQYNWKRKRQIFSNLGPYIAVPSLWLKQQVEASFLAASLRGLRVIPNGIDDTFFQPQDQGHARRLLGLPSGSRIILFAANTVRDNIWKDFQTMRAALELLKDRADAEKLVFVCLGDCKQESRIGKIRLLFEPFKSSVQEVAAFYHACDIYLHAARAETFSLTIAEAMACARPVVASAVGAIPERINDLKRDGALPAYGRYDRDGATGMLTAPGDPAFLAREISRLLDNPALAQTLGRNAAREAAKHYRQVDQAQAYLSWFEEILAAVPDMHRPLI